MNDEANRNLAQHDAPEQTAVRLKMGRLSRLAWLPIPVLLATMVALRAADLRTSHESLNLLIGLNFIFSTLPSLAVAFLMGRAFLLWPSPGMLMVGCGVLIWGVGSFVAPLVGRGNPNVIVTIHNLCVWLAACCHLAGVSLSGRLQQAIGAPRLWVGAAYTLSLGLVWLVAQAVPIGWMPFFFVQGQGGTQVRQFVLGSAISMLVLTSALLWSGKGRPWSAFAYWYSRALLLLATGLFGVMIQSAVGSLLGWTGRAAQFLGGAYMIMAALASTHETSIASIWRGTMSGARRQRYIVAIVITIVAAAVRLAFLQTLGMSVRFITFYPAVMLSALYGGLGPGVVATLLSAVLASYLWVQPAGHFLPVSSADLMGLTIFFINCMAISWIVEVMRRAQVRTHMAQMQARVADERERAAQVLQQSEAKYRSLFENMINGLAYHKIVTDKNGKPVDYIFLEVNNAFERLTGLKRPDVVGKRVTEVLPGIENDPADWIGKYGNVALTGAESRFEQYGASLDKWYSVSSFSPVKDYFVTIFEDITGRKQAEAELEGMRVLLAEGQKIAHVGSFEYIVPTGETVWSDEEFRIYGLEPRPHSPSYADLMQKHFHPDDAARVKQRFTAALRSGSFYEIEHRIVRPDGSVRDLYNVAEPHFDAQGEMAKYIGATLDITERKRAEEALRESEGRYRELVHNANSAIIRWRRDGAITFINEYAQSFFGYSSDEIVGKHVGILVPQRETTGTDLSGLVQDIVARPQAYVSNVNENICCNGRRVWMAWTNRPIFDERGQLAEILSVGTDITERKRAEEALKKSRAELEERVKERTRQLDDSQKQLRKLYSHLQSLREEERTNIAREIHDDLGQALTVLKMDLSWIAGKLRDDNKELKERLNADVHQVDKTIQAVKRVCTELRPGILDHLGLAAAIEWQAEEFQKRTGIKCEVVCDPEDIEVDTSLRTPLFRIFQEALTNILKHAKATEVKASFRRTNSGIMLEITDNGIGITEEDLSKPNSFGLLGMRERVYPLEGKVTVRGIKNKGTTVEVIIPVTTGEPL